MNKILRALYAGDASILESSKDEHVLRVLTHLNNRLQDEMDKTYRWLAACTAAVEAGRWGGDRRVQRRLKLLRLINQCRTRLGLDALTVKDERWAYVGLHYGYGAIESYRKDRSVSFDAVMFTSIADSHGTPTALSFLKHTK